MEAGASSDSSPSGHQWAVAAAGQEFVVVEVGGGIRCYRAGGSDVVAGFGADEQIAAGRGQQLMPWPNRIRDGRYAFGGEEYQLALSEPAKANASHGLVRWALWTQLERTPSSLTVGYRLHPQQGWAWRLDLATRYQLDEHGLTVTTTARNVGAAAAPFGYGAHPYLSIGGTALARVDLTVPAERYLEVDEERLLPRASAAVDGTPLDFRVGRPVGGTELDTAFTDLAVGESGRWEVTVGGLAEGRVTLWADRSYPWVQVFTGRAHPDTEGTSGIAVEPMTCPPDAFNSGVGLVVLEPGEEHRGSWGVTPSWLAG